ncbi:MAG: hypothetical protein PHN88_06385 [Ignavibacteria bacterium]|nr:hypothetical protein [Ignavibacteria bacterium]
MYSSPVYALYCTALTVSAILSVQLIRRDKSFVFLHLENAWRKIFLEYTVLTLPVIIPSVFSPYPYLILVILILYALIARVKHVFLKRTRMGFLGKIISPVNFEWLSGVRKHSIIFAFLYAVTLSVSGIIILPLLCLWLITVLLMGFYRECEPLNMLNPCDVNAYRLLNKKIIRHSALLACVYLPILIINSIFNPALIIFNIVFLVVQITVLTLAILFKYRLYTPGDMLHGNEIYLVFIQVFTILPFIMGGIPFLLPLPLFLCVKYYREAENNLNDYLYA